MKDIINVFAEQINPGNSNMSTGINTVNNGGTGAGGAGFVNNVINILNGVIAVLGLVAVVVVIIGGVNYMTSSGDTSKVKKAKDTILYGLIGLAVAVLAFALVNFVIANIIGGRT